MALNDEVIGLLLGLPLGVVAHHHGLWQTLGIFCIGKAQVIHCVGTLGFKHTAVSVVAVGADTLAAFIRYAGEGVGVGGIFVMELSVAPIGSRALCDNERPSFNTQSSLTLLLRLFMWL